MVVPFSDLGLDGSGLAGAVDPSAAQCSSTARAFSAHRFGENFRGTGRASQLPARGVVAWGGADQRVARQRLRVTDY